jgi:hypothetical protein
MSAFQLAIEDDFINFLRREYPDFWKRVSYTSPTTQRREISLPRLNHQCVILGVWEIYGKHNEGNDLTNVHLLMYDILSEPSRFEICLL